MIKGFNFGQIHHFAQMKWQNEGVIPKDNLKQMVANVPADMLKVGRFSGTMSNFMNLGVAGYNHPQLSQQIKNKKGVKQPTKSYLYAFVQLYKDLGLEGLYFTANVHKAYLEGKTREMFESLDFVFKNCRVLGVELGNECDMEAAISGVSAGSPTLADRLKIGLTKKPETFIADNVVRYMGFLSDIAAQIKRRYGVPVSVTGANDTSLRGRTWNSAVKSFDFYDAVVLHPYITANNKSEVDSKIDAWFKPFSGYRIWCTETNWNYLEQAKPKGSYHNTEFRKHLFDAIERNGAEVLFFHTIWAGDTNANNW